MMRRTLGEFATVAGGRLSGADRPFAAVGTDTRTLAAGSVFVALTGPNHDGHDYVVAALERGAVGAVVARELPCAIPQIVVADPLEALSIYARAWRRQFSIPVVGITGSNGKTTTKELTGAILAELGPCHTTRGNLNNHIGVPLTLLEIGARHSTAVIEMGANHVGEIAHLASLAEPTVGLVTNAGAAHLEGFGDLDGVARGKGELFESLGERGIAVLNADDDYAAYWRGRTGRARVVTFGVERAAEFTARNVTNDAARSGFETRFDLVTPVGEVPVELRLAGMHNVRNALAAAAAAWAAGAGLPAIRKGLAQTRAVSGRLERKPALRGASMIDDSYNANPSSVRAGLDALASLPGEHWFVLGEMAELGSDAPAMHAGIGGHARATGVTRLYAVGGHARAAVEAFGAGAEWFASVDQLIEALRCGLHSGVTVLIKGSRVNRLERVASAIAADVATAAAGQR
jgi:UDP-N-acetylmuramoyl-tripeptide--D-alanyl-D-alanine ligase